MRNLHEHHFMDFTLTTYRQLLTTLRESGYTFQPFREYLQHPAQKTVILRHDVDKLPENALSMAQLEHSLGIQSTYFFRIIPEVFQPGIIQQIESLGHEVGYHYEDLRLAAEEVVSNEFGVVSEEEVSSRKYEVSSDEETGTGAVDTPLEPVPIIHREAGGARGETVYCKNKCKVANRRHTFY